MFNKKQKKIWEIFNTLLFKFPKHPTNINESDVFHIYKRATLIYESYEKLDYIYLNTGEIDDNIIKGMEIE